MTVDRRSLAELRATIDRRDTRIAELEAELAAVREALGGPNCPCTVENITGRMKEAENLGYSCGVQYQEHALYKAEQRAEQAEADLAAMTKERDWWHETADQQAEENNRVLASYQPEED